VLHNWTLTSTIGAEVLKSRIVASGGMPDSIIRVRTVGVSAPLSCTLAGVGSGSSLVLVKVFSLPVRLMVVSGNRNVHIFP
jgi:hypothetical protein